MNKTFITEIAHALCYLQPKPQKLAWKVIHELFTEWQEEGFHSKHLMLNHSDVGAYPNRIFLRYSLRSEVANSNTIKV